MTVALGLAVAVLVVASLLNNRYAPSWYLLTAPVTAAVLLVLYGLAGGNWALAGLGPGALRRGPLWTLVVVALVALVYLVLALLPPTRGLFADRRARQASGGSVAFQVLVRIPFATVALEEVAFRAVLYGLARTAFGTVWATVLSAVLFGLWHVPVAPNLSRDNPAVGATFGSSAIVPATVAAMAAAGVLLCELQRRSGSLLTPAALHWAVNALGLLTAFLVARRARAR